MNVLHWTMTNLGVLPLRNTVESLSIVKKLASYGPPEAREMDNSVLFLLFMKGKLITLALMTHIHNHGVRPHQNIKDTGEIAWVGFVYIFMRLQQLNFIFLSKEDP